MTIPPDAVSPEDLILNVEVAIVGGGPAGLMAADVLSQAGVQVHLFDAMPSVGRKFLLAGKGGLNLTHAEPAERFHTRFGERQAEMQDWLSRFGAQSVRDWAHALGIDTFVGSSGRVFPQEMKAAPLLRAWLHRLRHPASGVPVQFHMRHRWLGWHGDDLVFESGAGAAGVGAGVAVGAGAGAGVGVGVGVSVSRVRAKWVLLALGGASWPRLGSDGAWVPVLAAQGIQLTPLQAANCGFDVLGREGQGWTTHFRERFAGQPLKSVVLRVDAGAGATHAVVGHGAHQTFGHVDAVVAAGVTGNARIAQAAECVGVGVGNAAATARFERQGEFVITDTGVEGSLIYAASAWLRQDLLQGAATAWLDLLPNKTPEQVLAEVRWPRGSRSLSSHLKSRLGIDGVKMGLVHELCSAADLAQAEVLAKALKNLPLALKSPRPVAEAISTAGGVALEGLTPELMLHKRPNVFCAGEMLDWEAPTGGYLLTACLSSGWRAGHGMLAQMQTAKP